MEYKDLYNADVTCKDVLQTSNANEREQQWLQERKGYFTASGVHKLLVGSKKKKQMFGDTALSYIYEVAADSLTGEPKPQAYSAAMQWGKDHEAEAMQYFIKEWFDDAKVLIYGGENPVFFKHDTLMLGGSPDGLIEDCAIIEIKCPYNSAEHIRNLEMTTVEEFMLYHKDYYAQVQSLMMCTDTFMAYFVSYDPRIENERFRLSILEIPFNPTFANELTSRVIAATELKNKILNNIIK
jgi:hypothetical protein